MTPHPYQVTCEHILECPLCLNHVLIWAVGHIKDPDAVFLVSNLLMKLKLAPRTIESVGTARKTVREGKSLNSLKSMTIQQTPPTGTDVASDFLQS